MKLKINVVILIFLFFSIAIIVLQIVKDILLVIIILLLQIIVIIIFRICFIICIICLIIVIDQTSYKQSHIIKRFLATFDCTLSLVSEVLNPLHARLIRISNLQQLQYSFKIVHIARNKAYNLFQYTSSLISFSDLVMMGFFFRNSHVGVPTVTFKDWLRHNARCKSQKKPSILVSQAQTNLTALSTLNMWHYYWN